jgi:tetratricopeptide (TPR) repeat protein
MARLSLCYRLLLLLLASLAASANILEQRSSENTAVTPQQLRRAAPPPADASAEELIQRGDELRAEKAYLDASDYYRAALEKGGPTAAVHNRLGMTNLGLLRYKEAKKDFERAIKLDRSYPEAQNNLGVVFYIQRKFKRAISQYQRAISLRSDSASFYSNLGSAHFARKDYEKASEAYLRALELDPDVFERHGRGGVSAHLSAQEDRAYYSYTIAKTYARRGLADRALQYLKKAMEEGYKKIDDVYKDEEFASLRQDPRFAELMASKPAPIPN